MKFLKLPNLSVPRRNLFIFSVPVFLAILLAGIYQMKLFPRSFLQDIQGILEPSQAKITLEGEYLVVKFKMTSSDKNKLISFAQNLGVSDQFLEGFRVSLDTETADFLRDFFPVQVSLSILPDGMHFSSNQALGFFKPIGSEVLKSTSSEGSLKVESPQIGVYNLEIDNPEQVLHEATISGKLSLSKSLSGWQWLAKLSKIKLKAGKHFLEGIIVLN